MKKNLVGSEKLIKKILNLKIIPLKRHESYYLSYASEVQNDFTKSAIKFKNCTHYVYFTNQTLTHVCTLISNFEFATFTNSILVI